MTTLTEFLLARIAEDVPKPDYMQGRTSIDRRLGLRHIEKDVETSRASREIKAKRDIVGLHGHIQAQCATCADAPYPCETLRALGAIYADHPHYLEAWAE